MDRTSPVKRELGNLGGCVFPVGFNIERCKMCFIAYAVFCRSAALPTGTPRNAFEEVRDHVEWMLELVWAAIERIRRGLFKGSP